MASLLNWLDVSAEQQRRVRDIIRLFEEPGTLREVAHLAREWFSHYLLAATHRSGTGPVVTR